MENNLAPTQKQTDNQSTFLTRLTKRFKLKPSPKDARFGHSTGIVWEIKSHWTGDPIVNIVQIERAESTARVTIYDGNDRQGTSVTNIIEDIASGVYLDQLAGEYSPDQIQFFHRDTIPSDLEPQWGTKPVALSWNKAGRCFENPNWDRWRPDFEIPDVEKALVRELRAVAAVAIETWMRHRHERGEVTPRQKELYDRYQEHISAKSENYRYNLRGGWIFVPPGSYL